MIDQAVWADNEDLLADVVAFHYKFNQLYEGPPRHLPPDLARFRFSFSREEHHELGTALEAGRANLVVDALLDKIFVDLGTLSLMGVDVNEAWRRVVRANMSKVLAARAPEGSQVSGRDMAYDIVKPPGFEPPDHRDLVPSTIEPVVLSQRCYHCGGWH